jgi:hypothetical protein
LLGIARGENRRASGTEQGGGTAEQNTLLFTALN